MFASFDEMFDGQGRSGYRGLSANIIAGDRQNNIGYQHLVPMFRRKDDTPFLGCRILDGTTSAYDWTDEIVPLKELPRSLNPSRGYISNGNNRQTSDHAKTDYGATQMATARSIRIDEYIS